MGNARRATWEILWYPLHPDAAGTDVPRLGSVVLLKALATEYGGETLCF